MVWVRCFRGVIMAQCVGKVRSRAAIAGVDMEAEEARFGGRQAVDDSFYQNTMLKLIEAHLSSQLGVGGRTTDLRHGAGQIWFLLHILTSKQYMHSAEDGCVKLPCALDTDMVQCRKGGDCMDYKFELEKMRENFEQNRPDGMRLHRPWWMFADEELSKLYTEKLTLLEQGKVYYASLLQANVKLFSRFPPFDYPAQIIYSASAAIDEVPEALGELAKTLFSYKYSKAAPPEEWREIVENIRNEKDRTAFCIDGFVEDARFTAKIQTIMVFRKHLPTHILKSGVIPVIACPEKCNSVLILPSEFWTKEFKEAWLADE